MNGRWQTCCATGRWRRWGSRAFAAETIALFPKATVYKDYRVMLEKEKGLDGVIIGMPTIEMQWMQYAGMTPMQIIVAATSDAAPRTDTYSEARLSVSKRTSKGTSSPRSISVSSGRRSRS